MPLVSVCLIYIGAYFDCIVSVELWDPATHLLLLLNLRVVRVLMLAYFDAYLKHQVVGINFYRILQLPAQVHYPFRVQLSNVFFILLIQSGFLNNFGVIVVHNLIIYSLIGDIEAIQLNLLMIWLDFNYLKCILRKYLEFRE